MLFFSIGVRSAERDLRLRFLCRDADKDYIGYMID